MRVAFITLGCRLNQAEEGDFAAAFASAGWTVTRPDEGADVYVVHSCTVTRAAERETLRLVRGLKAGQRGAVRLIVLSGCVVEHAPPAALRAAGADLLIGRAARAELVPRVLSCLGMTAGPSVAVPPPTPVFRTKRALLRVQDGCGFGCAYCIVPHTRGAPVSRRWNEVLNAARALIAAGHQELVITGCNLACYHDGARGLADLTAAVCGLEGLGRVRLGSVEPATVERELADVMASCRKLCRCLHLPLQSGDDAVLRAMGRRYTADDYRDSVAAVLRRVPGLGLGTDVISGLPGEDEDAFRRTRELLSGIPCSNLHVFAFSPRPGTRAALMPGRPPVAVARRRARELRRLGAAQRQAFAATWVGREVEVLIESLDDRGNGHGWSDTYLPCCVPGIAAEGVGRLTTFIPTRAEGTILCVRR
ncbi:MAG: MiaB/RimO family radical SAM methylthiotransferase [Kiritimatiellae bacterium]|nr:MiaB/RimO family radical SAM methylthiotransferase [Kiritimatiellia bacterium]